MAPLYTARLHLGWLEEPPNLEQVVPPDVSARASALRSGQRVPESADAAYRLGIDADAGQSSESREAFARALKLLETSSMTPEQKGGMRKEIRSRTGGWPQVGDSQASPAL